MGKKTDKAIINVMKEAHKELKRLAYETNPKDFSQTEKGYADLLERLEYVKGLIVTAKIFQCDLLPIK